MKFGARIASFIFLSLLFSFHSFSKEEVKFEKIIRNPSMVYVSKILDGNVAAIDVSTDTIVSFLKTGRSPAEIAVVDVLDRAYVADLTDGTVTVVNTTNNRVEGTIDVGNPVAAAAADQATRKVYAVDFSNGTPGTNLHVIEANSNTELADIPIGTRLQNIALEPGENRAYVTDFVEGIIVVNTLNDSVITSIPLTGLPHGIAVNQDANTLYVTQLDNDAVVVIDTVAYSVVTTLKVGSRPQWIGLDILRNKAFVTNEGDGTVSVVDISTHTVLPDTIPVGVNPLTLTMHSGAAKAYVYNVGDGTISVIDTIGEVVVATISVMFGDGFESGDTEAWSSALP
jgi:YVTN family beta-propeller protein